jgi:hypothetical protein
MKIYELLWFTLEGQMAAWHKGGIMQLLSGLLALSLLASCTSIQTQHQGNALVSPKENLSYIAVQGLYSNHDYAYAVSIPQSFIGCRDQAPSPNHGFGIDLTDKSCQWMKQARSGVYPKSYLYVDASYNGLEWEAPADAVQARVSYLKGKGITNILLESKKTTNLSNLSAASFIMRYNSSGESMTEEMVIAFRKEKDADIVYTLDLATPSERYSEDREVLTEIQKTWNLQPLP